MKRKEIISVKKLNKRDLILILVIIAVAACLLILGLQSRKPAITKEPDASETPAVTETGSALEEVRPAPAEDQQEALDIYLKMADEYLASNPAESYLLVETTSGMFSPIPLVEDASFKVNYSDGEYNIVHIGKNSVYMESSTCDNQNCVGEGEVTLENRDTRVLYNMIVCLPHDLLLELIEPAEAREYLAQMYQAEAEYLAMQEVSQNGE